ncbi:MAG: protease modulator HflC [Halofilum sp. (in: g-proteobacteria)]|nr:protease modulator HflC [Halofilum sp. (in: g-proteobacteria)]
MNRFYAVVVALAIVIVVAFASTFTVHVTERAIKLELGDVVNADYEPGLHFKIPLYQTVYRFDDRILTMDAEPDRVLTVEKKNLIVDAFVKWEIIDTVQFFESTGGDEDRARSRLHEYVKNQLYDEFGKRTINEVVSGERLQIMNTVQKVVDEKANELGINVVDVRIKKVELPEGVRQPVYDRMEQERHAVAQRHRAEGREEAQRIRAEANREVEEILAQAYREAQTIRGEGDARATQVYAQAYKRDPEFYAFYRSLLAYENAFDGGRDALVLEPDSEFFEYFGDAQGRGGETGGGQE